MRGDFTRFTFKKENHYRDVRMQQGRVQLDADWNEQLDITAHRIDTETVDVVGQCGAPMHHGGFHVVTKVNDLTPDEQKRPENQNPVALKSKGDFYISGGRYYLDGILCENEHIIAFTKQPDLPRAKPVNKKGTYLAYLDVWQRHITALEAPHIREVALGGPDTTTRTKTVWQLRWLRVGNVGMKANCLSVSKLKAWGDEIAPGDGKLAAQAETSVQSDKPCILAPDAGYRRLENQLYRVEVHTGGNRGKATFKWSRDNGSIVAKWEKQDVDKLTVSSTGRDQASNFASGQWIELTDDTRELSGDPGTLVKIIKVEGNVLTIDPATATGPVNLPSFPRNPKVRRWDLKEDGVLKPTNLKWIDLEDGVQVQFSDGTYKTGDYWLIPARTAAGKDEAGIEWPVDEITNKPELQLPHGIHHHFCRLALLEFDGNKWINVRDCSKIFPPVSELTTLLYVSGDGQEAMPGMELPQPLQVGVANGQWPVPKAKVNFKRLGPGGSLIAGCSDVIVSSASEMKVLTDTNGVAECKWKLDSNVKNPSQQVEATLLDAVGNSLHLPIRFTANLSVASKVAYDPKACPNLKDAGTVQKAIDQLCQLVGGVEPGIKIEEILRYSKDKPVQLMIDEVFPVSDFTKGLFIVCDVPIDPAAVQDRAVGTVTLELPYPLNKADREVWKLNKLVGFEPIIIAGDFLVTKDPKKNRKNHAISWKPAELSTKWLTKSLFVRIRELEMSLEKILIRLELNGSLIWGEKDRELYLDADLYAKAVKKGPLIPIYPSGDGRRGGVLNMRFWLIEEDQALDPPQIKKVTFKNTHSYTFEKFTPMPQPNFKVAEKMKIIEITFTKRISKESYSGLRPGLGVIRLGMPSGELTIVKGSIKEINKNTLRFIADEAFKKGNYAVIALGDTTTFDHTQYPPIKAEDGAILDGDFDREPGGNFQLPFKVA